MTRRARYVQCDQVALRKALGISTKEWPAVQAAAADAHMHPVEYARLMVLAAAGCGGVTEHLERVISAGADVDKATVSAEQHLAAGAKRKARKP